ncbi:4'-phosphopantetheinyl transferase family protein [Streptomyces sp. NPDC058045]|uniref:4'-phosphopantetheinyl transferase family protein n=1 Tax=Streptomyces sp. NPDC058045 TaxID=3346311 RepID=UPI0036E69B35
MTAARGGPWDAGAPGAGADVAEPAPVGTWLVRVGASAAAATDLAGVLDEQESRRLAATRHEAGRLRYLVAHVGLRVLLGARLGESPGRIRFRREACPMCGGPHGRPAIDGEPGLHFSLSHSGDTVLYGLAARPVGVDIEAPSRRHARFDLSSHLHPDEQRDIAALPAGRRTAAMLNCWVRKEAYLKGTGAGIAAGVGGVYTGLGPEFSGPGPAVAPPGWALLDVQAPAGHPAAAAVEKGSAAVVPDPGPLRPWPLHLHEVDG